MLSGIIWVKRHWLRWQDALSVKTLYNRFARWSWLGNFARIFQELTQPGGQGDTLIIDIKPVLHHRFRRHRRGFMNTQATL